MKRVLSTICCLVVFATITAFGVAPQTAEGSSVRTKQNPIVSTGGSGAAGGTLTGTVEGIAPPVLIDETATAFVTVRMNGWIDAQPALVWDEEDEVWVFKYDIPHGMKDAVLTVTVTDATTGTTTTQTLIVSGP